MRLIDADAMLETLARKYPEWYTGKPKDNLKHYVCLVYYWAVKEAPTIDPVRHGRWIVIDAEEPRRYGCSECKRLSWHMENYCPCCGSKMDEEVEE